MAQWTERQVQAITLLREQGEISQSQLAQRYGLTRGQSKGVLNRLADAGYLETRLWNGVKYYSLSEGWDSSEALVQPPDDGSADWLAGYEEGRQSGYTEGWNAAEQGYKDSEEYRMAVALVRRRGRKELAENVLLLVSQMQSPLRVQAVAHTNTCWRKHPLCALEAVRKMVEKEMAADSRAVFGDG